MKFKLMSDLHTEFVDGGVLNFKHDPANKDIVLILAGDIGVGLSSHKQVEMFSKEYKHIMYILGNHDFYNYVMGIIEYEVKATYEQTFNNVSVLLNESIRIGDVNIWGGTFWSDSSYDIDPLWEWNIKRVMTDYRVIKRLNESSRKAVKFDPKCQAYYHAKAFKKLDKFLTRHEGEKNIVVTHHAPSIKSSLDCYKGSDYNVCYYTPLDNYIERKDIALWCHGHMHNASDYMIGETRVVANPYGYHGVDMNPEFNENFIIEI